MTRHFLPRFLTSSARNTTSSSSAAAVAAAASSPKPDAVDSDFAVIMAALLCALICILGLVAVARCAWIRRFSAVASRSTPRATANKGLKKKVLRALPKLTYSADFSCKLSECAICLTEFAIGDEIRLLPQCGHGFHVGCIDMWLGSHSSCPSCRQILVVARCQTCGGVPSREMNRDDGVGVDRFLP